MLICTLSSNEPILFLSNFEIILWFLLLISQEVIHISFVTIPKNQTILLKSRLRTMKEKDEVTILNKNTSVISICNCQA